MQANNLLVTGDSRFLNEIHGKIDWTNINNKPTIPTVNNATLTIQKNGTNVQTFTANQSTNATANITVPTKVSELTNDSGYTKNMGTVTSVKISATSPIAIDSSAAITTSGTRTISHANSGVTAGTYRSVTVNATGHVTAGTNPTTLSGYGITDAKIASGTITLGSNTITPLTSSSTLNAAKLSGTIPSSCYTDTNNAVTQTVTDSTDATYELLFSGTADNTTRTEGARKSKYATFNPSKTAFTFGIRASGSTIGDCSLAEGILTTASGGYSHAEGYSTVVSGDMSHAEGYSTMVSGTTSHAEGIGTIANHRSQHVFGEYNIEDPSTAVSSARGKYIEIVGRGNGSDDPSNARTLDWDGNEWLAGTLTTTDVINSTNWDGTNTSLKNAISAVNSKVDKKNTGAFFISFNNATVKNSTITNLGSHKFAAGGWLIEYFVVFSSNATGIRRILISNTSTGDVRDRFAQTMVQATSGTETRIQVITIQSITADATLYFNAVQNSGSNLTASSIGVKGVKLY